MIRKRKKSKDLKKPSVPLGMHISFIFTFSLIAIFISLMLYLAAQSNVNIYRENLTQGNLKKVKILLVPGHEPDFGGTEFKNIKERDLVVQLANNLKDLLEKEGGYEVFITRDTFAWHTTFNDYFNINWDEITTWEKTSIKEDLSLISSGTVPKPKQIVRHNPVSPNIATRLYGITKWANENTIDLMIHIHINDDATHAKNKPGKQSGFAIYVPIMRYSNGPISHNIAQALYNRLITVSNVSTLKGESTGIVDEPRLIAIGAHNTAKAASMVIEYGYIYEPKFVEELLREKTLQDLATQTFLGIQDYFN
jgi:N-acetylmuramoyl-L-alanine amidase